MLWSALKTGTQADSVHDFYQMQDVILIPNTHNMHRRFLEVTIIYTGKTLQATPG